MINTQKERPNRRRYLTTNLRTAVVLLTIACVGLAWWNTKQRHARIQREAVLHLQQDLGAYVGYAYKYRDDGQLEFSQWPPGPLWVHRMVGRDVFGAPIYVSLVGIYPTSEDLDDIVSLTEIEVLELVMCEIRDSDVSRLARLSSLARLDLRGTSVTTECVEQLKKQLPQCVVLWDGDSQK
jgi:hypothetical protein